MLAGIGDVWKKEGWSRKKGRKGTGKVERKLTSSVASDCSFACAQKS